jgi:hypothetical protein
MLRLRAGRIRRSEGIFGMNPCANCGASPRPADKFCNTCGTPIPAGESTAPAYTAPAGWGAAPPPPRCQMGHDVPPGQNYCPQGHPIALEQVQFAPPAAPAYGASPSGSGAKYAQAGQPAGAAPAAPGYGAPAANAYGGAPPQYPPQALAYPPPAPPPPPPGYAPPPLAAAPPVAPGYSPGHAIAQAPAAPDPKVAAPIPASALTGFLVSFDANPSGDFWPLSGGRHTLGRANSGDSVDIPLADATISSRHAVIDVDALAGKVHVEDTGSTNGTFVNDDHVGFSGRRELKDGDKLRLGGFTTLVKVLARG